MRGSNFDLPYNPAVAAERLHKITPDRNETRGGYVDRVAADRPPSPLVDGSTERAGAMIYTRMGVVFHAAKWSEATYGIKARGVWSTGPTSMEVFLPWTSVDSIRLADDEDDSGATLRLTRAHHG